VEFCQFLEFQALPHKRKAHLLKTFWRRFYTVLGAQFNCSRVYFSI